MTNNNNKRIEEDIEYLEKEFPKGETKHIQNKL